MVPIYAVDSWLALHFSLTDLKDVSIYINTARSVAMIRACLKFPLIRSVGCTENATRHLLSTTSLCFLRDTAHSRSLQPRYGRPFCKSENSRGRSPLLKHCLVRKCQISYLCLAFQGRAVKGRCRRSMPPSSTVLDVRQPVPESSASLNGSEEHASLAEIELRLKDLLSRKDPVRACSVGVNSWRQCCSGGGVETARWRKGAAPATPPPPWLR